MGEDTLPPTREESCGFFPLFFPIFVADFIFIYSFRCTSQTEIQYGGPVRFTQNGACTPIFSTRTLSALNKNGRVHPLYIKISFKVFMHRVGFFFYFVIGKNSVSRGKAGAQLEQITVLFYFIFLNWVRFFTVSFAIIRKLCLHSIKTFLGEGSLAVIIAQLRHCYSAHYGHGYVTAFFKRPKRYTPALFSLYCQSLYVLIRAAIHLWKRCAPTAIDGGFDFPNS